MLHDVMTGNNSVGLQNPRSVPLQQSAKKMNLENKGVVQMKESAQPSNLQDAELQFKTVWERVFTLRSIKFM